MDRHLDTGIVFQICHYWEIRKVVLTECAAMLGRHRHSNYDVVTPSAVGRGMHCPNVSSFFLRQIAVLGIIVSRMLHE